MLTFHLNAGNLWYLNDQSAVPLKNGAVDYAAIKRAGIAGLQHYFPEPAAIEAGLEMSGMARIVQAIDAKPTAQQHKDWGFAASTWHVGTGFESDSDVDALARAVLDAQSSTGLPIFIETHRATITQDIRRTLDLIERFPELRFNADLSHWYSGLEMPYGDFEAKLRLMQPLFERVRYMHGRIGHSCAMQLPLALAREHLCWQHFEHMWTLCLEGFEQTRQAGESLIFAPELLPAKVDFEGQTHFLNYALELNGSELSDRWLEALDLIEFISGIAEKIRASAALVPPEKREE